VRRLQRRRHWPRASSIRPAGRYLAAGADLARRLGHNYIGTEHVLRVLVEDRDGAAARLLSRLGIQAAAVEEALACWLPESTAAARIDPRALASLGIDFDAVRERLERTFGPGALERTRSGCLSICPRLKLALAYALDQTEGEALRDEHILLGILDVPESVGARVLSQLGVSSDAIRTAAANT
jgi:ATP-dependent Clp protease ATP-binding subunit ClpA